MFTFCFCLIVTIRTRIFRTQTNKRENSRSIKNISSIFILKSHLIKFHRSFGLDIHNGNSRKWEMSTNKSEIFKNQQKVVRNKNFLEFIFLRFNECQPMLHTQIKINRIQVPSRSYSSSKFVMKWLADAAKATAGFRSRGRSQRVKGVKSIIERSN